ncbi:MAG: hypothetical protein AAFU80_23965 [Pseudomonadota bacterium]
MAGKRDKPEEIVVKLRQVEVLQGQGVSVADAAAIGQVLIADGLLPVDPGMLRAGLGVGYEDVTRLLKRPWGRQIREDFAVARTVHAQGWLLSRTEASLCLLAALAYGPQNV